MERLALSNSHNRRNCHDHHLHRQPTSVLVSSSDPWRRRSRRPLDVFSRDSTPGKRYRLADMVSSYTMSHMYEYKYLVRVRTRRDHDRLHRAAWTTSTRTPTSCSTLESTPELISGVSRRHSMLQMMYATCLVTFGVAILATTQSIASNDFGVVMLSLPCGQMKYQYVHSLGFCIDPSLMKRPPEIESSRCPRHHRVSSSG